MFDLRILDRQVCVSLRDSGFDGFLPTFLSFMHGPYHLLQSTHFIIISNNIKMKLALASLFVASASAFAPSSMNSVS